MNKTQLTKTVGQHVRLQPHARRLGVALKDSWAVEEVDDRAVSLKHLAGQYRVRLGVDAVRSYMSDPNNDRAGVTSGWLQLLAQIDIAADGSTDVTPLPLDALGVPVPSPLDSASGQVAASRYRGLPTDQRAAIAYVLIIGTATERQVLDALGSLGYGSVPKNVLGGICEGCA
jgi:hypothetical protein